MWPPRPLCPPSFGIFPKIHPFWRRHLSLSHWLCSWRFSLVSYFTFVFFVGTLWMPSGNLFWSISNIFIHYFSSWHQEPCSSRRTPTWLATTRGALEYLTRTKSSTNSATLTSNSSLSSRTPAWSSWGIFGRSRSTPGGLSAMSSWPTRPCRSPSLSWDRSNSSSENQRQEYGSTLASSQSKQFFSCDFSNFTFGKQIFHKQNIFMTMIFGIFCHVISQVSDNSENHSTYKTFQVLGPLLPIFNAHHGRDPRLETDAVRAHDRYL